MPRRCLLRNTATAASLLLCLAALAAMFRSYHRADDVFLGFGRPYGAFHLVAGSSSGQLRLGTAREQLAADDPDPRRARPLLWRHSSTRPLRPARSLWRFPDGLTMTGPAQSASPAQDRLAFWTLRTIGVPLWLIAAVSAVPPILWTRARRRHRRRTANGHCPTCGYDLRATPARCPECGASPAATS